MRQISCALLVALVVFGCSADAFSIGRAYDQDIETNAADIKLTNELENLSPNELEMFVALLLDAGGDEEIYDEFAGQEMNDVYMASLMAELRENEEKDEWEYSSEEEEEERMNRLMGLLTEIMVAEDNAELEAMLEIMNQSS